METGFGIEPNSPPFTGDSTGLKPAVGTSQLNQSRKHLQERSNAAAQGQIATGGMAQDVVAGWGDSGAMGSVCSG